MEYHLSPNCQGHARFLFDGQVVADGTFGLECDAFAVLSESSASPGNHQLSAIQCIGDTCNPATQPQLPAIYVVDAAAGSSPTPTPVINPQSGGTATPTPTPGTNPQSGGTKLRPNAGHEPPVGRDRHSDPNAGHEPPVGRRHSDPNAGHEPPVGRDRHSGHEPPVGRDAHAAGHVNFGAHVHVDRRYASDAATWDRRFNAAGRPDRSPHPEHATHRKSGALAANAPDAGTSPALTPGPTPSPTSTPTSPAASPPTSPPTESPVASEVVSPAPSSTDAAVASPSSGTLPPGGAIVTNPSPAPRHPPAPFSEW